MERIIAHTALTSRFNDSRIVTDGLRMDNYESSPKDRVGDEETVRTVVQSLGFLDSTYHIVDYTRKVKRNIFGKTVVKISKNLIGNYEFPFADRKDAFAAIKLSAKV